MGVISFSLPQIGQPNSTEETKIPDALSTLRSVVNGGLDKDNLSGSAGILLTQLANLTAGSVLLGNASGVPTATALSGDVTVSNTGVTAIGSKKVAGGMVVDDVRQSRQTLLQTFASFVNTDGTGTFVLGYGAKAASPVSNYPAIYLDPADYAISGQTTGLRLRLQVATQIGPVTTNFNAALYSFAPNSGSNNMAIGSQVSGGSIAQAGGAAGSLASAQTSTFTFPSAGLYVIVVNLNVAVASLATVTVYTQLQLHHT